MNNPILMGEPEKKIELELDSIHMHVSSKLNEIKKHFPPQYKITLVARNTDMENADIVLTEDTDTEAIKTALDNSKVKHNG